MATAEKETDQQSVLIVVKTDVSGVVQKAEVAFLDIPRVTNDPRLHALADRAIKALTDPRCAKLPLPSTSLDRINTLTFRFHSSS